jgi:hypothetical protein
LLNQRKSHAIPNTHTQNCKEKAVAIQNLHWELLQELKQTVWGWRDEYERLVMWWVLYHKTSHEDPTSQFSFQTISLKKIPSSCFVS